jgi:hypothetical protein
MNIHPFDVLKEKVVRDGKVAVLVSYGFGAGWYTWHGVIELVFDPVIVDMVESNRRNDIQRYVEEKYLGQNIYLGGIDGLSVEWVPDGAKFRIEEYDGSESLVLESEEKWITA